MRELSQHLEILAEPARVRMLVALSQEELSVGELVRVVQLPQSTVSRHLKILRTGGWVHRRADGTSGWMRLDVSRLPAAAVGIWEVVRGAFEGSLQHQEDKARLEAARADRRMDSRTFFGREHARWDALRAELFGRDFLLPALLSLWPSGLRVADLGCGTGEAVASLAPFVAKVIGVDREAAMLRAAARRCEGMAQVELRCGGLEELPLEDGEVDAALLMLVLHHVEDVGGALREAARAVRPGGRIVVLDMRAHGREDYRQSMGHLHLGFSPDDLVCLAEGVGLSLCSLRGLPPEAEAQGPPLFLAVFGR